MDVLAWLFEDIDRDRLLDMDRRLAPARRNALAVLGLALLVCSPWLGPWTLLPLFLASGLFRLATRRAGSAKHPEYLILGAWVATEAIIALAVALTGGPRVATMGWLAIPIVTLFRFSERVAKAGAVIALTMLGAVAFGTDLRSVLHNPPLVVAPAATIIAVALLLVALIRSDVEHRGESLMDDLTELWNRRAFASHAEALVQQGAVTGETVAVIFGDIDEFKLLNDLGGHSAGDSALRQVAARLRGQLRAFDLLYRYGGEEVVVLLPGANLREAAAVAEKLRAAVAANPLEDGVRVTMSFGVTASEPGTTLSIRELVSQADTLMYRAKEQGRNQVCTTISQERITDCPSQPALVGAGTAA
jgi:diguanylate cyclase (GGDEF)-like protein